MPYVLVRSVVQNLDKSHEQDHIDTHMSYSGENEDFIKEIVSLSQLVRLIPSHPVCCLVQNLI